MHKAKDKEAMQKMQEREKLRLEVIAEYQASANSFVADEISKAKFQLEQEFEKRVAEEALKSAMKSPMIPQFQPFVATGFNNGLMMPFDSNNKLVFGDQSSEMDYSVDPNQIVRQEDGLLDTTKNAMQQRRRNQQNGKNLTNTIRNQSEE